MPAQVVIIHENQDFRSKATAAIEAEGLSVAAYEDPLAGMEALEHIRHLEVLITRLNFRSGRPNGLSLATMAKTRKWNICTIFLVEPEMQNLPPDMLDIGIPLYEPVCLATLVETVMECFEAPVS